MTLLITGVVARLGIERLAIGVLLQSRQLLIKHSDVGQVMGKRVYFNTKKCMRPETISSFLNP